MKKTFIIIVILIAQLVSCQTIVPLSTLHVPDGAYVQDTNNNFDRYIGTWEGILNNKKYEFVFVKFAHHYLSYSQYYEDMLMANFKVTDLATGTVLYDNTAATVYEDFRIMGVHPDIARGMLYLIFKDTTANCGNSFNFYLRNINGQPNQLTYCYFRYGSWGNGINLDCPNYSDRMQIPIFLPQQNLILTKQ